MTDAPPDQAASAMVLRPGAARALALRALFGACLGVLVALFAAGALVFPYYRDDRVLDRVVREVAMDWRDFGEERAQARLEYELDRARIGAWVRDEDCDLVQEGELRRVRCAWWVNLTIPGTERRVPLAFGSTASVRPDGVLGP